MPVELTPPSSSVLLSMLITGAWWVALWRLRRTRWRLAIASLGGTLLHELMHFLAGFLLRARPSRLSVFPRQHENRWTLGTVQLENLTIWNAAPVALAPLALAPLAYFATTYGLPWLLEHRHFTEWVAAGYLAAAGAQACWPSREDWRLAGASLVLYTSLGLLGAATLRTVTGWGGGT